MSDRTKTESQIHLRQQDAVTRLRIGEELDKNFMVEAAAGTGKTTCIVDRMANLIASGACRIEQLVAVTFTRKAAAELRERFRLELRQRAATLQHAVTTTSNEYDRLLYASDNCSLAFVGTIHSFCAALLRERPIEFGVDPSFREWNESDDLALRERAWSLNIDNLVAAKDPLIGQLADLGLERNQLKGCFDRFIEYRDVKEWPTGVTADFDIDTAKRQTREYVDHMQRLMPNFPDERGKDVLMNRYEEIVRASERAWRSIKNFFQFLERFDSSKKATNKWWHDPDVAKAESKRFNEFRVEVAVPALQWWYRKRYQFVVDFLRRAVAVYDRMKLANRGLGFSDLLMSAAHGLKSNPGLRKYFQARFTHLLVDEFQDTDPIQAEMILFLTSKDHEQQDWQKCAPKSGSLFLVGDPKQSIYRFRRGDTVTYCRVREIFQQSGGEVLKLMKNFRSGTEIIDWNNRVFESKFLPNADQYQAASERMLQGRVDSASGELTGVRSLLVPSELNIDDATLDEADSIARYIRFAIDSGMMVPRTEREFKLGFTEKVEARDFLVLPRNKVRMRHFKHALERYGIPCEVSGSNAFDGIAELAVLKDCLLAIDDVQNPVHYLALLRERLFGFSDVELYEFRQAGGRFSYSSPLPERLGEALRTRFEAVNGRLSRYQGWLRALPFAVAVGRIAEDLGLLANAAAASDGNVVAGGFMRAIEALRQQCFDFDSVLDFVSYLEELLEMKEIEGCTALPPDPNVVRVMNLHKAKGLEAPIVFLADTSSPSKREPGCHIDRTNVDPVGYMGIVRKHSSFSNATKEVATPPNWVFHQEEERRFLRAESERLLYVATTRAACMLVVSIGKVESSWGGLHPFLADAKAIEVPTDEQLAKVEKKSVKSQSRTESSVVLGQKLINKWSNALTATYVVETAKHLGLKGTSRPRWEASGDYGYQWGSAVHELLEAAMKRTGLDQRASAIRLANEYKLGSERVDALLSTVQSVVQSAIWKRAQASSRCYSELPFETSTRDGKGKLTIIRGVMDLVFEERNGWAIVDYKTDDIKESEVASAVAYYGGQLAKYAEQWKHMTGFIINELGLYFTRIDRYVRLADHHLESNPTRSQ